MYVYMYYTYMCVCKCASPLTCIYIYSSCVYSILPFPRVCICGYIAHFSRTYICIYPFMPKLHQSTLPEVGMRDLRVLLNGRLHAECGINNKMTPLNLSFCCILCINV